MLKAESYHMCLPALFVTHLHAVDRGRLKRERCLFSAILTPLLPWVVPEVPHFTWSSCNYFSLSTTQSTFRKNAHDCLQKRAVPTPKWATNDTYSHYNVMAYCLSKPQTFHEKYDTKMRKQQAINGQNTVKQKLTPNYLHLWAIKKGERMKGK